MPCYNGWSPGRVSRCLDPGVFFRVRHWIVRFGRFNDVTEDKKSMVGWQRPRTHGWRRTRPILAGPRLFL